MSQLGVFNNFAHMMCAFMGGKMTTLAQTVCFASFSPSGHIWAHFSI